MLTEKATVLNRTSIIPLSIADKNDESVVELKQAYRLKLKNKLKHRVKSKRKGKDAAELEMEELKADMAEWAKAEAPEFPEYKQWTPEELGYDIPGYEHRDMPELMEVDDKPDEDGQDYNGYVSAKVLIPRDGRHVAVGVVKRRARDSEGELIGKTNPNPLLDSAV